MAIDYIPFEEAQKAALDHKDKRLDLWKDSKILAIHNENPDRMNNMRVFIREKTKSSVKIMIDNPDWIQEIVKTKCDILLFFKDTNDAEIFWREFSCP